MRREIAQLRREIILDDVGLLHAAVGSAGSLLPLDDALEEQLRNAVEVDDIANRVVRGRTVRAEHAATALDVIKSAQVIADRAFADAQTEMLAGDVFDRVPF